MSTRTIISVLTAIFCCYFSLFSQNLTSNGRFPSKYFSIKEYGSAAQIWAGIQNKDGRYIFGNRQDILTYNGNEWLKVNVDKEKTTPKNQSLAFGSYVSKFYEASSGIIYVGRENNFGYLGYSSKGEFTYFPLYVKPEKEGFGKIWNIFEVSNGEVLFVGQNAIFSLKNKKITPYKIPTAFNGMITKTSCRIGKGMLLVYQTNETLEKRKNKFLYIDILTGNAHEVAGPTISGTLNLRGSFEINGNWYVLDLSKKIFKVIDTNGSLTWDAMPKSFLPFVQNFAPNTISKINQQLYYCTEDGGLIVSDLKGNIQRTFNFDDDLENIFVNNFFIDRQKNTWLCLDNGIQFIETSSPLTFFKKRDGITSQIEAIDFSDAKHTFVGLHTDIFEQRFENHHQFFSSVNKFKQVIFDIETITAFNGQHTLIIGYNGVYEYNVATGKYQDVAHVYGYAFTKDPTNPNRIFLTLESGLGCLEFTTAGKWKYTELISNAGGETISATALNGKIYFSIRNVGIGIYSIQQRKYEVFPIKNKDKDNNNYYVQAFQNKLFVGTGNGLYQFDPKAKKFNIFSKNDSFFGTGHKNTFHRVIAINNEQLWVVIYKEYEADKFEFETGYLTNNKGRWVYTKWPLSGLKGAGIISAVQRASNGEIWLGANEGLFVFNPSIIQKQRVIPRIIVDRFELNGEILAYNLHHTNHLEPINYNANSFKISFHANRFSVQGKTTYRYKLTGFNDDWTEWSELNYANFVKVSEGEYTLMIQAKDFYGNTSAIYHYNIVILPPWYRTFWAYLLYIIVLTIVLFGIIQLSTKRVKNQNSRLEEIVQQRTKEIANQNQLLEIQKSEITQKTTDILDSIHYAKRIQTTILPRTARLNELFDEHFVFYRPKDIVSGDFYWARAVANKMIFSAIDCTGHGVPGALVSIVGNNALLRAVNEFNLSAPNEILDKVREIVVSAFLSDGEMDVKDGMDIALCSIDFHTGVLNYAGANNECVIIRNEQIIELKPDKQPIGQFIEAKPFTNQVFQLEPGDCIYLYTDGYVDQFGGERMKKFKSKPFRNLLAQIANKPMNEQFSIIQRTFDNWKGNTEQVDDVCVFGVKFNGKRK